MELSHYQLETLHRDGEFILYRGRRRTTAATSPASILALSPVAEHPAPATIKKIEHEFSFKDDLSPAWAVRPIALTQHQSRTMLLCEDPDGEPLDRLVRRPMDLEPFLRCAISLAAALARPTDGVLSTRRSTVQRPCECGVGSCLAPGLRDCLSIATRAPARAPPRIDRRHARLYGARANRQNESVDRFTK